MKHGLAAIPDDGIGKEVVPEGRRVLNAAVQFAAAPTPPRSSACAASCAPHIRVS
jgi:isocitrate/isopropylmalate dehydrogenase